MVNAANNLQAGLPNAGLAQGGMFVVKGRNLGVRGTVVANSFPLGTTMGGTSMKITVGGTAVDVVMVYVVGGLSDDQGPFDQLAGIVPSNTPTGSGTLTVTFSNQTSAAVPVTVLASAFGIFSINQAGYGPGVFTDPNFKVNTLTSAAHAGDLLFIWGTGLGAIRGSDANAPPVGNLNVPVDVYVGGVRAVIGYQGRSGCCSGIDQILITIPAGVQGCYVPVVVKTGSIVSNFVTTSIALNGSLCSDPTGFSASELQKAQTNPALTVADVSVSRLTATLNLPSVGAVRGSLDAGAARFRKYGANPSGVLASVLGANSGSGLGLPSVGCTVYPYATQSSKFFLDNLVLGPPEDAHDADGGVALSVTGPLGAKQVLRENTGGEFLYQTRGATTLGGGLPPLVPAIPEYLVPGSYTVNNGSGSADIGGFSASLTVPSMPANVWANQDAIFNISLAQDLTITFNPVGDNVALGILGASADPSKGQGAALLCVAPPGSASITVPGYVLSALPASGLASDFQGTRLGYLAVGAGLTNPTRFVARGIDAGYFTWGQAFLKNVNFQ